MPRAWKCATCGDVLKSWAASERHADGHGGARIDLVLSENIGGPGERANAPRSVANPDQTGASEMKSATAVKARANRPSR